VRQEHGRAAGLLYWYKSTNTDSFTGTKVQILTAEESCRSVAAQQALAQVLSLLALLVQKYKY
jgi:hypothetical protein